VALKKSKPGRSSLISVEADNSFDRLNECGQRLCRWARGLEPTRESSVRRQAPPPSVLALSGRMIHYWRHHPNYVAASSHFEECVRRFVIDHSSIQSGENR